MSTHRLLAMLAATSLAWGALSPASAQDGQALYTPQHLQSASQETKAFIKALPQKLREKLEDIAAETGVPIGQVLFDVIAKAKPDGPAPKKKKLKTKKPSRKPNVPK